MPGPSDVGVRPHTEQRPQGVLRGAGEGGVVDERWQVVVEELPEDPGGRVAAGWRESRFLTAAWSRGVAIDEENLRAGVATGLGDRDGDAALQLLGGLWPYWTMTGRTEAVGWLEQALELDGVDDVARADVTM